MKKTERLQLRLSVESLRLIEQAAEREGRTRSNYIVYHAEQAARALAREMKMEVKKARKAQ